MKLIPFSSRLLHSMVVAATMTVVGMSSAQAASITCGDLTLGLRETTVDPALSGGLCYAGLQNLGDGALVTLLDSLIPPPDTFTLVDRDDANSDVDGLLSITGVGGTSGGWSIPVAVWDYTRVFLYFHFGDAQDDPNTQSLTDPDIFIVELAPKDTSGTWSFGGGPDNEGESVILTGLSNIALLRSDTKRPVDPEDPDDPGSVPEPGVLFLMGAGLVGLGMARRRKSA